MRVGVMLFGGARVVIGQPQVEVSLDISTATLAQVVQQLCTTYPRARPYLLDETDRLPSSIRVLLNNVRLDSGVALATMLNDQDTVTLLVTVAGGRP